MMSDHWISNAMAYRIVSLWVESSLHSSSSLRSSSLRAAPACCFCCVLLVVEVVLVVVLLFRRFVCFSGNPYWIRGRSAIGWERRSYGVCSFTIICLCTEEIFALITMVNLKARHSRSILNSGISNNFLLQGRQNCEAKHPLGKYHTCACVFPFYKLCIQGDVFPFGIALRSLLK